MSNDTINRVRPEILDVNSYSVPKIDCSIRLDGNESPFPVNPQLLNNITEKVGSVELNRYPDPDCAELKKVISERYDFPPDGILLGNGSDELIQMLVETVSGTVLVPNPTFSMYRLTSYILGNKIIETELDNNFDLDTDDILKKIKKDDPDLLFFASPNNPTGNAFSADKILKVVQATTALVVVDEAYFDYYGATSLSLVKRYKNLVVLRTFSKIGFAAIRLGMLFGNEEIVNQINKTRLPYNINTLTQRIGEIAISNEHLLKDNYKIIVDERERMLLQLKKISSINVYPSDANFFLIKVPDADYCFNKMVQSDILIRNLSKPGRLSGCIRVTIGTPEENDSFLSAMSTISFS